MSDKTKFKAREAFHVTKPFSEAIATAANSCGMKRSEWMRAAAFEKLQKQGVNLQEFCEAA